MSDRLRLVFSATPYRKGGGFSVRGFYIKSPATLGKPLIYVNSAHHLLAVGTAFCHEVAHHLTADMLRASGAIPQVPRLFFGAEYSAHMDDPVEMAADIMVSLAGYPGPMARQIFRSASNNEWSRATVWRTRQPGLRHRPQVSAHPLWIRLCRRFAGGPQTTLSDRNDSLRAAARSVACGIRFVESSQLAIRGAG